MSNIVFCNWVKCKYNLDEICKKTAIMLETIEKEGKEVLICKSYESGSDLKKPFNNNSGKST